MQKEVSKPEGNLLGLSRPGKDRSDTAAQEVEDSPRGLTLDTILSVYTHISSGGGIDNAGSWRQGSNVYAE